MLCVYLMFSHGLTVLFAHVFRWLTDDDKYKHDCCIPIEIPAQGGLTCLYLEALCSGFCWWSVCQPLKICDSSGIANWGWWKRFCLRTLNGFTHKPVSLTMLANEQHCQIHARKKANLRAISSQKWINITQYSSILHDTWCNIEFSITQYYIVKHTILPNITWNLM